MTSQFHCIRDNQNGRNDENNEDCDECEQNNIEDTRKNNLLSKILHYGNNFLCSHLKIDKQLISVAFGGVMLILLVVMTILCIIYRRKKSIFTCKDKNQKSKQPQKDFRDGFFFE